MIVRLLLCFLIATLLAAAPVWGQAFDTMSLGQRFVDPANGLSLEQVIERALQQEPSLRSARSEIDVARSMRTQASLRRNPSISFDQRTELGGTDRQTMVSFEWPLALFRRDARVAVADRDVAAAELAARDRGRLVAAEARGRYGDLLANVRDLMLLDGIVAVARRQYQLLAARVEEGASPPLDRNVLDVELRRLESDRLLQAGRTEAAMFDLKRALGMRSDAVLAVRDTLDQLVQRESSMQSTPTATPNMLDERPDVREAANRIEIAAAKIDRAASEGRFDVSIFAGYARMDAAFPQRGVAPDGTLTPVHGRFHYVSAGATVMLPLLNRNQGDVSAARAERDAASAAYEAVRLSAQSELAAARARDERSRQAVAVYSTGAQLLARQNLTVVSQSYELGRLTVFEVLTEQRRYLDVERAYTEALRTAFEARTALNQALGELP
jgi:cobalt-zinc-cadmium efflux system outer membrane protein